MLIGDLAKLGRIAADIESLADVPRVAAPLVAERLEQLVALEFDAGVDPYGEAWKPLAPVMVARGRLAPPLTDTRELRSSFLAYPLATGGVVMTIGTSAHPAGPHQDGWLGPQGEGPSRPIFPTGALPEAWRWAIDDAIVEAVTDKLGEVAA